MMETLFYHSFLWVGISFFGMGLLLAFTPCILPMLPILAGILNGTSTLSPQKAFLLSFTYVLAMSMTYAFAGILAAHLGYTLQSSLQTPLVLGSFAVLLLFVAFQQLGWLSFVRISFLGHLSTFLHKKLPQGSFVGAAGMGLLATLIASPCVTAPMVGALTYIAQTGDKVLGGFALWMMGLGLGTPLLILGTLGGRYIPKTGPWMKTVQHFFALILMGLSFWFFNRIFLFLLW